MKYIIKPTKVFQKDLKLAQRRGCNLSLLTNVIKALASGQSLPPKNHDHTLSGNFSGCRECHITPDWLLIYKINEDSLILFLTRTGSHSDLY